MNSDPIIQTACGRVRGTREDGVYAFRGIPYAEAPIGSLRFRPPVARTAWDGVLDATRFGERHPQDVDPVEASLMKADDRPPGGEDCLNLNVWTPDPGASGLPVFVWLHGGSLKFGAGSDVLYDGATYAREGVVAVTLNYRLHPAGFLGVAGRPGAGAFGLLDQIAALAWVQDNIAAFGGDPGAVTVAGESAGAHSVGQLLAAPAARGTFRRAVLQSGAASFDVPVGVATIVGAEVLRRLGVRPGDDAAITRIDTAALLDASREVEAHLFDLLEAQCLQPNLMTVTTRITSLVAYGGDVVPRRALDSVADGAAAGIDLLIGTNLDEATLLFPPDVAAFIANEVVTAAFGSAANETGEVLETYRRGVPDGSEAGARTRLLTDTLFRIPAIKLAEAARPYSPNTYMYLFAWGTPPTAGALGAYHALDLPYMWNRTDEPAAPFFARAGRQPSEDLAAAMHGAWVNFVKTGEPQHTGLPQWPRYDTDRRATMRLDDESAVVDDPLGAERRLWEKVDF
jgi:para-nitrobenzyl esterase